VLKSRANLAAGSSLDLAPPCGGQFDIPCRTGICIHPSQEDAQSLKKRRWSPAFVKNYSARRLSVGRLLLRQRGAPRVLFDGGGVSAVYSRDLSRYLDVAISINYPR